MIGNSNESSKGYEVYVSMLEIYNEKVQDLLVRISDRPKSGLKVRESKTIGVFVEGLTKYPVTSYEDIQSIMEKGYENRTIGSTLMNATSSRAHTIVNIQFNQFDASQGQAKQSRIFKSSNINLIDLAGSERTSMSGTSGDRLKEGCNINKSLLVLGNVINTLSDKATGKKKDCIPPFRDSVLTRILQNALGGNSKTVMICALSPSINNYEETLSTLRYADRAKNIKTKAVINESEHDKIIRLLREENLELKKKIEELGSRLQSLDGKSQVQLNDEIRNNFFELTAQYKANSNLVCEMERSFHDKLQDAKARESLMFKEIDISKPYLLVLNEDPQLSGKLKYSLKDLPVYVGRGKSKPPPEIVLSGIGIKSHHCVFIAKEDCKEILIKPRDPEAKEYIFVNGKKLTREEGLTIRNLDRIILGSNTVMILIDPSECQHQGTSPVLPSYINFSDAQMEQHAEMERIKNERDQINEIKNKKEIELMRKDLEEKYIKERKELERRLNSRISDYEEKFRKIKAKSLTVGRGSSIKSSLDFLHKRSPNLEMSLVSLLKKVFKMKQLIEKFGRMIVPDVHILCDIDKFILERNEMLSDNCSSGSNNDSNSTKNTKDFMSLLPESDITLMIRVENYEKGVVYYWSTEEFHTRFDDLTDYIENPREFSSDPLLDAPQMSLLGFAFYKLESIAYLLNHSVEALIISTHGVPIGSLGVDIMPLDLDNQEFTLCHKDTAIVGMSFRYKINIKSIKWADKCFCNEIIIEYKSFTNESSYKTNLIHVNPHITGVEINQNFYHEIEYLSEELLEYLLKESLCFKIYGKEILQVEDPSDFRLEEMGDPESINLVNKKKADCLVF